MARVVLCTAIAALIMVSDPARASAPPEIMAVLAAHCVLCHDAEDPPKGLRLDTTDGVARAIASGMARPGDPDASPLVTRLGLADDEDGLMPPVDAPSRPDATEVALLRAWIAGLGPLPDIADVGDTAPLEPAPESDVTRLQSLGAHVGLLHRGSTWLRIDLARVPFPLAADALESLRTVGPWVREISLVGSAITENLAGIVRAAPRVRVIDASRTRLTTLDGIADAAELSVLNLTGSGVGDEALLELAGVASLTRLYVAHTAVTPAGLEALRAAAAQLVAGGVPSTDVGELIGWTPPQLAVWRVSEALWSAYSRRDWEGVGAGLHERWAGVLADGRAVSSVAAWQEAENDGAAPSYVVTRHTPVRVRVVNGAAVVQSEYDRVPPVGEPDRRPDSLILTETFVSTENGWKALSSSVSREPTSEAPW